MEVRLADVGPRPVDLGDVELAVVRPAGRAAVGRADEPERGPVDVAARHANPRLGVAVLVLEPQRSVLLARGDHARREEVGVPTIGIRTATGDGLALAGEPQRPVGDRGVRGLVAVVLAVPGAVVAVVRDVPPRGSTLEPSKSSSKIAFHDRPPVTSAGGWDDPVPGGGLVGGGIVGGGVVGGTVGGIVGIVGGIVGTSAAAPSAWAAPARPTGSRSSSPTAPGRPSPDAPSEVAMLTWVNGPPARGASESSRSRTVSTPVCRHRVDHLGDVDGQATLDRCERGQRGRRPASPSS